MWHREAPLAGDTLWGLGYEVWGLGLGNLSRIFEDLLQAKRLLL